MSGVVSWDARSEGMTITVEAVYHSGQLQLAGPVPLPDGTAVRLTITPLNEGNDPLDAVLGIGESDRTDGAAQHDHYIYGTPTRA
jgi:hypothetical protein